MKTTLQQALDLLESAPYVRVADVMAETKMVLSPITDQDSNEVAAFFWNDGEYDFSAKISEHLNNTVTRDGNLLYFIDSEGEPLIVSMHQLAPFNP